MKRNLLILILAGLASTTLAHANVQQPKACPTIEELKSVEFQGVEQLSYTNDDATNDILVFALDQYKTDNEWLFEITIPSTEVSTPDEAREKAKDYLASLSIVSKPQKTSGQFICHYFPKKKDDRKIHATATALNLDEAPTINNHQTNDDISNGSN